MRRWPPSLLLLLSVAGAGLVIDAVLRHTATLTLVVIVPVVSGSSPELVAGSLLIVAGFLAWAFASAVPGIEPEDEPPAPSTSSSGGTVRSGGVVLVGPFPIFFGAYRPGSSRARWAWVAVGILLTVGVWIAFAILLYAR